MNMLERYPDDVDKKNKITTLFGNAIKAERIKRNLTLEQSAELLKTTHTTIWYLENCEQCANTDLVEAIAKLYSMDLVELAELNFLNNKAYRTHRAYMKRIKK